MINSLRYVTAILVVGAMASCTRVPKPFDFTFTGRSSAAGYVMMDQLSADNTKGIMFSANIAPDKGNTCDLTVLKCLHREGVLKLEYQVGSSYPMTIIHVYEFTNAVSGFTWYHGNFQKEVAKQWEAESGNLSPYFFAALPRGGLRVNRTGYSLSCNPLPLNHFRAFRVFRSDLNCRI